MRMSRFAILCSALFAAFVHASTARACGPGGPLSAEEMISFQTGIIDRGLVREGLQADLNVFDPARVGPAVPRVVSDLPAGRPRLLQRSEGFRATLVAGQVTVEEGEPTGAYPGRLFRNRLAGKR